MPRPGLEKHARLWYTDENIKQLTESNRDSVESCQKNIGYFISYKDLFSTWVDPKSNFDISNVRDALSAFKKVDIINFGSQIRSYVLEPYKMVKDHRTDFESTDPEGILDGEIKDMLEYNLRNLK